MLDPKKDRFDYKEILKAPPNYYFDFAITTTYSLDLEALMEVLIALGLDEEIESNLTKHEFYSLSSIMNMMENIAIFCDASKIHFKDISKKNIFLSFERLLRLKEVVLLLIFFLSLIYNTPL